MAASRVYVESGGGVHTSAPFVRGEDTMLSSDGSRPTSASHHVLAKAVAKQATALRAIEAILECLAEMMQPT